MSTAAARSPITTHVLDTALGQPARDLGVKLEAETAPGVFTEIAARRTDADGRVADLLSPGRLATGAYRLTFDTGAYLRAAGRPVFFPRVEITFDVAAPDEHHHIPLLLSPFGYSTYRGS